MGEAWKVLVPRLPPLSPLVSLYGDEMLLVSVCRRVCEYMLPWALMTKTNEKKQNQCSAGVHLFK